MTSDFQYDNLNSLYDQVHTKISHLFSSEADSIKTKVKQNVDAIRSWLPKDLGHFNPNKNRLDLPAYNSLKDTLSILSLIEYLFYNYQLPSQYKAPFFMVDLLSGAHILIDDQGELLSTIKTKLIYVNRFSSHYRNEKMNLYKKNYPDQDKDKLEKNALRNFRRGTPDYSVRAELVFKELLIGEITKENKTYTWLQFERHSLLPRKAYKNGLVQVIDNILNKFSYSAEQYLHQLDYIRYLWHGMKLNIGQYGNSRYTESNPLKLKKIS